MATFNKKVETFECGICAKRFGQKYNLWEHIINVQENIKDFECSIYAKLHLQRHTKNVHENIKNFECDICGVKLGQKNVLWQHIKVVHENIKYFQCNI